MASMNEALTDFLLTWLFWWSLLSVAYGAVHFTVDALLSAWQRRRHARRQRRAEIERINREAADSVQRLGTAFAVAQHLMRAEVATRWGGQR
jgi:hypothetical protein